MKQTKLIAVTVGLSVVAVFGALIASSMIEQYMIDIEYEDMKKDLRQAATYADIMNKYWNSICNLDIGYTSSLGDAMVNLERAKNALATQEELKPEYEIAKEKLKKIQEKWSGNYYESNFYFSDGC